MAAPKGNKYALGNEGGRPPTWTPERIAEEAATLLEWANTDDAIVLREFSAIRGYSPQWINWMVEKSEVFAEAQRQARILVGARREKGALRGNLDSGIVKATLATYDEEHRAMLKEMKKAEAEGSQAHALKALADHFGKSN